MAECQSVILIYGEWDGFGFRGGGRTPSKDHKVPHGWYVSFTIRTLGLNGKSLGYYGCWCPEHATAVKRWEEEVKFWMAEVREERKGAWFDWMNTPLRFILGRFAPKPEREPPVHPYL